MEREPTPAECEDARSTEALGLPKSTRACLFDLDGVLTRTAELHAAAWKSLFDEYLAERARDRGERFVSFSHDDYERFVDGKLRTDGARAFLASRDIHASDDELRAIAARKDELFLAELARSGVATYEGSVRYVACARALGLATAVVSSSRHTREVVAAARLAHLFDARIDGLVAAREHLRGKPAPDTYLAAARALGIAPGECAVFEDAIAGVQAGRAGHFGFVVGIDRADHARALLASGADIVVDDLASLARRA